MENNFDFGHFENYLNNKFLSIIKLVIFSYKKILEDEKKVQNLNGRDPDNEMALENSITNMLVTYLRENKNHFDLDIYGFELEPVSEISDNYKSEGFLDIKICNLTNELMSKNIEDVYFTFECKRLNHGKTNNYVKQGINRFKIEKYSKKVPVGGMIGYSELNYENINDFIIKINNILPNEENLNNYHIENFDYCYESIHERISSPDMKLYHLILDYSDIILIIN